MSPTDTVPDRNTLANHVLDGLGKPQKALSSAWFYDDEGSRLFGQIMVLPEYYLTRTEALILHEQQKNLVQWMSRPKTGGPEPVFLIELGCGNGEKSLTLVEALQRISPQSVYVPMDLSAQALKALQQRFSEALPYFSVQSVLGDYHQDWPRTPKHQLGRQVVMFMGSNLGNYKTQESLGLLRRFRAHLNSGDGLVLGLDLQKDPATILAAYNDSSGVTAAFNLNLLHRLNRELGMDFDLNRFKHYACYSPLDGVARSFLVSTCAQSVRSALLGTHFHFQSGETIYTEQSQKYTEGMITRMSNDAGFTLEHIFTDAQRWCAVCLLRAV